MKNYLNTDTADLEGMKTLGPVIMDEIQAAAGYTGRLARRALVDLKVSVNTYQAKKAITVIIGRYYNAKAQEWLEAGNELPPEYDEWMEINHAIKAHMLEAIGVEVFKGNGWMTVDNCNIKI